MSRLLETIKVENGKLKLLSLHQDRLNRSRRELFEKPSPILLSKEIQVPAFAEKGIFKCRIEYAEQIEKIEFLPYKIRKIESLQIVEGGEIDYRFKYADRFPLRLLFERKKHADDIIIIKNGLVTDSFYANLAFLKKGIWYTPQSPLLEGIQRRFLLSQKTIQVADIKVEELPSFEKIRLFNAMISWEEELDITSIYPLTKVN